jgi:hypothetical protein
VGWAAGWVEIPDEGTTNREEYGAVVAYPSSFSFWLSWPLWVGGEGGYCSAREWQVAAELMTVLVMAGQFLMEIPGAGPITCAVELTGFEDAVAFAATRERPNISVDGMPTAPHSHLESLVTSAGSLVSEPAPITRALLARWLIAFYSGRDLIESIMR